MNDEGKTEVPEHQPTQAECMERWKHNWTWLWVGGVWTTRLRCSTCGLERESAETGQ